MSKDTSSQEVGLSSTGSVKLFIFHGNGTGVAFQVWYNRLESALEFNYIEQTIKEGFTVPASHDEANEGRRFRAKALEGGS